MFQFPIPDPALTRGRVFSGGVAVIGDTWYQASKALNAMPIDWDIPPENATFNTANMQATLLASLETPGTVRVDQGNVAQAFLDAEQNGQFIEATYSTPYLPRARMEPGNAAVLVTDARVDVAHETGFNLVNPLSVKKQIEGQVVENNFDRFPVSRINEDPPEINIRFFNTKHWLAGMGHDRATSVQPAIAEAIFQITGRRYRDLPFRGIDLDWS